MKATLKKSGVRSASPIRQLSVFRFTDIAPGTKRLSRSVTLTRLVNTGEVIVSQRPSAGSVASPLVRYQFINAITGRPVTNSVTVSGTRTVVLPFVMGAGTVKLQITNVGTGHVLVEGVILVF